MGWRHFILMTFASCMALHDKHPKVLRDNYHRAAFVKNQKIQLVMGPHFSVHQIYYI